MSDNKRDSDNFSQSPNYYEDARATSNPLERINEPSAPGVFRIRRKETTVLPTTARDVLKRVTGGVVNVGMEVGLKKETVAGEERLKQELEEATALLDAVREQGIAIEKRGDEIVFEIEPKFFTEEDKKIENLEAEKALLLERVPLVVRYNELSSRLIQLQSLPDFNNLNREKRDELYNIAGSLAWLKNPSDRPDVTAKDITSGLDNFLKLLDELEKEIKLRQELLSLLDTCKKEGGLLATFIGNIANTDERDALLTLVDEVDTKKIAAESTLTRDTLDAFADKLNALKEKIAEALQKIATASPATTPADKKPSLDIWSGLPKGTNGRILANFEKEFRDYEAFLKNPREDTVRKIEECRNLIIIKNSIIDAVLDGDLGSAKKLIDDFRVEIEIERKAWAEKVAAEKIERDAKKNFEDKQKALRSSFEELNKQFDALVARKDNFLIELEDSPRKNPNGEIAFLDRVFGKLTKEREELQEKFDKGEDVSKETLENYANNFKINKAREPNERALFSDTLATIVDKIEERLDTKYQFKDRKGRIIKGAVRSTRFGHPRLRVPAVKNDTLVKLTPETEMSLQRTHQSLFDKNPEEYLDLYLNKKWLRDDPQKEVVKGMLEKNKEKIGDMLLALDDEKSLNEEYLRAETNPHEREVLERKIAEIEEKLYGIARGLKKMEGGDEEEPAPEESLASRLRETYSPSSNPTIVDVGRNRKDLPLRDRVAFDRARRSRILPGENRMTDDQLREARAASSPLSSDDPRASGMVRDVTEDQAMREMEDPNGFNHITEATREAMSNDGLEEMDVRRIASEKKKHSVGNLLTTRFKTAFGSLRKTPGNSKKIIACMAVAIISGIAAQQYYSKNEKEGAPQTAGEAVSWRDSLDQNERNFLKDLIGEGKLSFVDLAKKYAPSIKIDPNNPSTVRALSEFECEKLLNSPDPVYGLTPEQRVEVCKLVRLFEKTVQAADIYKKRDNSPSFIPSPYAYVDRTMNLENFYAIVVKIATETEAKEAQARKK